MTDKNMPRVLIRMPISVKAWLTSQTALNATSITAEVVRAIRERMERLTRDPQNTN